MRSVSILKCLFLFFAWNTLVSCQKEIDGSLTGATNTASQKPRLGTTWRYYYYTYHSYGGISTSKILTHKVKNEESLGGETWLNVIDVDADTTVYKLNTKAAGLFQYTNNASNLFCKYPASLNDTYSTYNNGSPEDFTVLGINDTLPTGIGDIPVNYYEGVKNTILIDQIWYNNNAWIVRRIIWRKMAPPSSAYYKFSGMYIDNIIY